MFNLSPQILSECACIQANHWLTAPHTRRKNCCLLTPSLIFSVFPVCAPVLGGRGGLCTYMLCMPVHMHLCVCAWKGSRSMEHVLLQGAMTSSSHLCTVLTPAWGAACASVCLRASGPKGEGLWSASRPQLPVSSDFVSTGFRRTTVRDDVKPPKNHMTLPYAEMQNSLCCFLARSLRGEYRMIPCVRDGTHLSLKLKARETRFHSL